MHPLGQVGGAGQLETGFVPCLPLVNRASIQLLPREKKPCPAALRGPARTPVVW